MARGRGSTDRAKRGLYKNDRGPTDSPVRLELARLVSSLLYGTRAILVLNLPAFESKKYTAEDGFHGNGPYGEILTNKKTNQNARICLTIRCLIF